MTNPRDLRELVGDDVPAEELERLRGVDTLLRAVPGPPELPASLTEAVSAVARPARLEARQRRRTFAAVALAAALATAAFGAGALMAGYDFEEQAAVAMRAGEAAPAAEATIRVGERDADGNWPLRLEVRGLEPLPPGGYYALWLAKDGEYAATCGSFRIGDGETEAEWTVSYPLREYDTWVVTAYLPDEPRDAERPWLLQADVSAL